MNYAVRIRKKYWCYKCNEIQKHLETGETWKCMICGSLQKIMQKKYEFNKRCEDE